MKLIIHFFMPDNIFTFNHFNTKPMLLNHKAIVGFLLFLFFLWSCSKKDSPPPDPCLGVSYDVQFFKTEAIGTSNNGTISITFPVGDTISYQLNNGPFQASPNFSNLAPGNYVITVRNQKNCTDTAQITILNYGPKYALVKQIITGYCGPCHLNGAVNGGKNFDTDSSILASWDRIKARAVDNNPTQMPQLPNAPLTAVDKQKITDWVNAGHRQSD
ncbi:MAG TPA: hypothetical protein PKI55_12895 [Chitinophagaceae bacterium]|nr:hypothetical protein [Chitinophagaceae bacterium]